MFGIEGHSPNLNIVKNRLCAPIDAYFMPVPAALVRLHLGSRNR